MKGHNVEVTIGDTAYPTIKAAAKASGYSSSGLRYRINKGHDCNGKPMSCKQIGKAINTVACICVETGKRYESIAEAAHVHNVTPAAVNNSMKRGCRAAGCHWERVDA